MMSSIFYGEIKEDKLKTWSENRNPYDILVENNRVERLGGWDFLFIAKDLFTDEVQVDWGSSRGKLDLTIFCPHLCGKIENM